MSHKIAIAQFYTNNVEYGKLSEEINRTYCNRHGYTYITETDDQYIRTTIGDRAPTWFKPKFILDVFSKFDVDYVLFLDADAVVVDFSQKIEDFIDNEYDVVFTEDYGHHSKMNGGVFLIKNTSWTKELMNRWWESAETFKGSDAQYLDLNGSDNEIVGYFKNGLWHDQTCMTLLYDKFDDMKKLIKIIKYHVLNWREPFDNNFVFHGFAYGHERLRNIDKVYEQLFNKPAL